MNIQFLIAPIVCIFLGIMFRYSLNDGWHSRKKWWPFFFFGGILALIIETAKYFYGH